MVDIDTFLTILYVMVDDFDKTCLPPERRLGPPAALTRSAGLTLALRGQWQPFASERAFYRYGQRHGRGAFPTLPHRAQFNRRVRHHHRARVACFRYVVDVLQAPRCPFELLDATPAPTREAKRRGPGWLPGLADIGWSNRLGGYEGFQGLIAVNPGGVITGVGFGAASTQDPPLAETFFAARHCPPPRLPRVGAPAQGPYLTDKGFEGQASHQHGREDYGAVVICAPKRNSRHPWPRPWRHWLAGLRPIVETVNGCLHHTFRLDRERPHALDGFQARLAAKAALHNFCIWLNEQLGRPRLAFADLSAW
jgi:hypothetical protein